LVAEQQKLNTENSPQPAPSFKKQSDTPQNRSVVDNDRQQANTPDERPINPGTTNTGMETAVEAPEADIAVESSQNSQSQLL